MYRAVKAHLLQGKKVDFPSITIIYLFSTESVNKRMINYIHYRRLLYTILWATTDLNFHIEVVFDFSIFFFDLPCPRNKPESNCIYILHP
jgi:hypothetical protein